MAPAGLLVLRGVLGALAVVHAAHWLFGSFAGAALGPGGLTAAASVFASTGLHPAFPLALAAGVLQAVSGSFLVIGLFTRIAAPVLALLVGARIWFDQARWGFFLNWALDPTRGHGMEHAILMLAGLACLAITGPGDWSVDGIRTRARAARVAGRARVRGHA